MIKSPNEITISINGNTLKCSGETLHAALTDAIIFALDSKSTNNKSEQFYYFCDQIENALKSWEKELKVLTDFE